MKLKGPKQRKDRIVEILKQQNKVKVSELETKMEVPASTIRRDLREMVQDEQVVRTHGYVALKKNAASHLPGSDQALDETLGKSYYRAMSPFLARARFFFSCFGAVPEKLVTLLEEKEIVTNSLSVAMAGVKGNAVSVIGDKLNKHTQSLAARNWKKILRDRFFEAIILEAEGFDEDHFFASEEQFFLLEDLLELSPNVMLICRQDRYRKGNLRKIKYQGRINKIFTDAEEFCENVEGKLGWEDIKVVDVNMYIRVIQPPAKDGSRDGYTNVVYTDETTWAEGKHIKPHNNPEDD
ncbi:DeoR family transcriptional regulator [Acidobacteriota bacterium]